MSLRILFALILKAYSVCCYFLRMQVLLFVMLGDVVYQNIGDSWFCILFWFLAFLQPSCLQSLFLERVTCAVWWGIFSMSGGEADGLIFRGCRPFSGLVDTHLFSLCFQKDDSFQGLRVSHGLREEVLYIYNFFFSCYTGGL